MEANRPDGPRVRRTIVPLVVSATVVFVIVAVFAWIFSSLSAQRLVRNADIPGVFTAIPRPTADPSRR